MLRPGHATCFNNIQEWNYYCGVWYCWKHLPGLGHRKWVWRTFEHNKMSLSRVWKTHERLSPIFFVKPLYYTDFKPYAMQIWNNGSAKVWCLQFWERHKFDYTRGIKVQSCLKMINQDLSSSHRATKTQVVVNTLLHEAFASGTNFTDNV